MKHRTKLAIAVTGIAAGVAAKRMFQKSQESEIAGDVVLITGGSRGLGLALGRRFAREGCRVAICARDEEELERARADIGKLGMPVLALRCDVTKRGEVEQVIRDVKNHFGRIDILVNNAGQIQVGPIETATIEDFEDAMDVMFWGTVYPTMALLPDFLERNSGRIVNITSIGGKIGVPHLLPYTSAKFAAAGFSEGLRAELSSTGIHVTTIAPGLLRTGSYNAALFKGDQEAESTWFSLGASTPGVAMAANRAARQIVSAVKRGESEKVLTTVANAAVKLHGMFPGLTQNLVGAVGSLLLPKPGDERRARPGWSLANLRSPKMRALLYFGRIAAKHLNQRMA